MPNDPALPRRAKGVHLEGDAHAPLAAAIGSTPDRPNGATGESPGQAPGRTELALGLSQRMTPRPVGAPQEWDKRRGRQPISVPARRSLAALQGAGMRRRGDPGRRSLGSLGTLSRAIFFRPFTAGTGNRPNHASPKTECCRRTTEVSDRRRPGWWSAHGTLELPPRKKRGARGGGSSPPTCSAFSIQL